MNEMLWQPLHTFTDGEADRVDGQIVVSGRNIQLDVSGLSDECVPEIEKIRAREAWERGSVFLSTDLEAHGVHTLVVPDLFLSSATVTEAVKRFNP